jgi:ATP-binding cassette subfamily B protein
MVILIFPIIIIGFMSGVIAQATASYGRIREVLDGSVRKKSGTLKQDLTGNIEVRDVTLALGGKNVLKDISFTIEAQSRTAILGPTAAGKTELLYLMTGLITPTTGSIFFDKNGIETYDTTSLYEQIGLVFQDSVLFNLSIRENIAFSTIVTDEALKKAIDTAELRDFIDGLPAGLDTVVSERGTSLS